MTEDANRRSTDGVILQIAGDVGYIKGQVETLVRDNVDHETRITSMESTKKTARGFLIGAAMIAGTTGSAIHTALTKVLEHLP